MFKQNEGKLDRILRATGAVVLAVAGFFVTGVLQVVFWALGGVLLFTAATGVCLLYLPFGINTKK